MTADTCIAAPIMALSVASILLGCSSTSQECGHASADPVHVVSNQPVGRHLLVYDETKRALAQGEKAVVQFSIRNSLTDHDILVQEWPHYFWGYEYAFTDLDGSKWWGFRSLGLCVGQEHYVRLRRCSKHTVSGGPERQIEEWSGCGCAMLRITQDIDIEEPAQPGTLTVKLNGPGITYYLWGNTEQHHMDFAPTVSIEIVPRRTDAANPRMEAGAATPSEGEGRETE